MPNIELLEKVLKHIEDNPETWDQGNWRCGTSYCFAGHAVLLSGWTPKSPDMELYWRLQGFGSEKDALDYYARCAEYDKNFYEGRNASIWEGKVETCTLHVPNTNDVVLKGGEQRSIAWAAQRELDLDGDTADILFRSHNTLSSLRDMIVAIKEDGRLNYDD